MARSGNSGKYWMLVAGAFGGVLLSRVLPPLLAQARGAAGAAWGEDPFANLINEHRDLLLLLEKMEQTPSDRPTNRLALLLKFKRTIAKHASAEEDVVYPLLHENAVRAAEVEKLYKEHAEMKIHLFTLQRAVNTDEEWVRHVKALYEEIAHHARQEEEQEFPRLRALQEERKSFLLHRNIRQEEALIL